jgi:hypothetical protein
MKNDGSALEQRGDFSVEAAYLEAAELSDP